MLPLRPGTALAEPALGFPLFPHLPPGAAPGNEYYSAPGRHNAEAHITPPPPPFSRDAESSERSASDTAPRTDRPHRRPSRNGHLQLTLFETADHPVIDALSSVDVADLAALFGDGFDFTDLRPPEGLPHPDDCPSFRDPPPEEFDMKFPPMRFWDEMVDGRPALGHPPWEDYVADRAERAAWHRFDDPPFLDDGTIDPLSLVVLADVMPGAASERLGASIRRDACASRLRAAPARNSPAVRSRRVIAMAADIPASYCPQPRESEIRRPGNPPRRVSARGR